MRSFAILSVFAALAAVSNGQTIDPSTVDTPTKNQWCDAQRTSCPLLCLQYPGNSASTTSNTCDPKTLVWSCVCAVNGLTPNASEYSQTIPYFECTEFGNQCVKGCGMDNTCASNCRTQYPCGAQNPTRVNVTSSSSSTATATGGKGGSTSVNAADYTGFGGAQSTGSSSTGKKSGAQPLAVSFGQSFGMAVIISGFFAGFALVL